MEQAEEILIAAHLQEDAELRRHWEEHRKYEEALAVFNQRLHLTPEEEVSKKTLQKRKLLGKEKLLSLLEKYRTA
jgi:hypothetical protein